jgi:hypothetical protein
MITSDQIEDYLAIAEVKARYCRFLDTKNWDGWGDLFTEDFEQDTRPSGGTLTHTRDEAVKMTRGAIGDAVTAHQVHSPEMTIEGDTATVTWAMQDRVLWSQERAAQMGNAGLTGFGHYHERYVRQDGRWRIAAQTLTRLHMDVHPLT